MTARELVDKILTNLDQYSGSKSDMEIKKVPYEYPCVPEDIEDVYIEDGTMFLG